MKVLLFAQLARAAGQPEIELDLPAGATGDDLWQALVGLHPGLERYRTSLRMARDLAFVGWKEPLAGAREVALIPPVSGG